MKLEANQRRAGVFAPVFALRTATDLGIGDTGGVREMIRWCRNLGFSVLQLLPIHETSEDHSPYNTISSLAIEPTTLEIKPELIPGLTAADVKKLATATLLKKLRKGSVQYPLVKKLKRDLLEGAFKKFSAAKTKAATGERKEWIAFMDAERGWLEPYTLFRALVDQYGHPNWEIWSKEHHTTHAAQEWLKALPAAKRETFQKKRDFFGYVQWLAHRQWAAVKAEADANGVYLMGDIPFGVSRYSADVWAHPQWFDLKWCGGSPPETWFKDDFFTVKWGQNWGVPLYQWAAMKKDNYSWWRKRVRGITKYFHLFRIDHVLGFYRIYAFPWQPKDNHLYVNLDAKQVAAQVGAVPRFFPGDDSVSAEALVNQTQGEALLKMVLEAASGAVVVAEDLGVVPEYVRPSLTKLGISGFKIPIFEREGDGEYKNPEQYPTLSIATLSTHDHETMRGFWDGWWTKFEEMEKLRANDKLDKAFEEDAVKASWEIYRTQRFGWLDDRVMMRDYEPKVREGVCRRLLKSASWLTVLMITDLLGLKTRFNVPGPMSDSNWSERLPLTVEELATSVALEPVRAFTRWAVQESDRAR